MDSLRWEVQRFEVENCRLRKQGMEVEECLDREAEMKSVRVEVAEEMECIKTQQQQLENSRLRPDAARYWKLKGNLREQLRTLMSDLKTPTSDLCSPWWEV